MDCLQLSQQWAPAAARPGGSGLRSGPEEPCTRGVGKIPSGGPYSAGTTGGKLPPRPRLRSSDARRPRAGHSERKGLIVVETAPLPPGFPPPAEAPRAEDLEVTAATDQHDVSAGAGGDTAREPHPLEAWAEPGPPIEPVISRPLPGSGYLSAAKSAPSPPARSASGNSPGRRSFTHQSAPPSSPRVRTRSRPHVAPLQILVVCSARRSGCGPRRKPRSIGLRRYSPALGFSSRTLNVGSTSTPRLSQPNAHCRWASS